MTMCLFVTHDVPGPQWQLGSPPSGRGAFALIGWNADEMAGGVPDRVVDVLAWTLAAFGRVTFPCSTVSAADGPAWQLQDADFVVRYRTSSFLGRVVAHFTSQAPDLTLLSTCAEEAIRRLFYDPRYPWWAQSQFAVLSQIGASPPEFDKIEFDPATLFDREWPERFDDLRSLGIQAILRPGVDGDVAGLLCLSSEVRDCFELILSHSTEQFRMPLKHVSAGGFARALASLPPEKNA
jgi:hypothetical protein